MQKEQKIRFKSGQEESIKNLSHNLSLLRLVYKQEKFCCMSYHAILLLWNMGPPQKKSIEQKNFEYLPLLSFLQNNLHPQGRKSSLQVKWYRHEIKMANMLIHSVK